MQNDKYYLIYDKKYSKTRETLQCIFSNKESLQNNILQFTQKIKNKYNINIINE